MSGEFEIGFETGLVTVTGDLGVRGDTGLVYFGICALAGRD